MRRALLLAAIAVTLLIGIAGCASVTHKPQLADTTKPRKIAIFFDGTNNDASSDTNIKKLHSLVALQSRRDIASLYIEGVGTKSDVLGMMTGYGTSARVRIAYAFLIENYRPGDEIYLFGFSRGAYAARILNSMLLHAGIPSAPDRSTFELATLVYDAMKADLTAAEEVERRARTAKELAKSSLVSGKPVSVKVLGLWDTVSALGLPDWGPRILAKLGVRQFNVDVANPNRRYGDKLCNVEHAFQALSLDDDRAWIFTPLLLNRPHQFEDCRDAEMEPKLLNADGSLNADRLQEVWFAGAHSDVGGGYPDSLLSGVSLNWMIRRLAPFNLLPPEAAVPEDEFGSSHDPESGLFSFVYHAENRRVRDYTAGNYFPKNGPKLACVHASVFRRWAAVPPKSHEYGYGQPSLRRECRNCLGEAATMDPGMCNDTKTQTQACDRKVTVVRVEATPGGKELCQ